MALNHPPTAVGGIVNYFRTVPENGSAVLRWHQLMSFKSLGSDRTHLYAARLGERQRQTPRLFKVLRG